MAFSRKTRTAKPENSKSTSLPISAELAIPDHFRCPISLDLMMDPVTAQTGITYDRRNIEKWLDMGNSNCPVTNRVLTAEDLIPNHATRRMIQDWCVAHRSHGIERIPTPRIPVSPAEASDILSDITLASQRRDSDRCLKLAGRVRYLEKESERNRRCFVSNGAPGVLASAFRMSAAEPLEVSTEILAALAGLLPFEDEIAIFESGSTESLELIMKIMKHGDIGSRIHALLMMKKIVSADEGLANSVAEKNGLIEALTEFVRKSISTQATKASLAVTFYLISADETIATKFVKMGLVPLILEILVDSDKGTIEKALAVLQGLCGTEMGREAACVHALTIPVLAKKMFRVSDMATEFVVFTLWKLCKNCKGSCLVECLQVGVFQKLLLLLQVGCSVALKERATEMLKLMSGCSSKLECIDTVDFRGLKRPS